MAFIFQFPQASMVQINDMMIQVKAHQRTINIEQ